MKNILLPLIVFLSSNSFAIALDKICDVSLLKGEVKLLSLDGKIEDVSKETVITEGSSIKTGENSFVKLVFVDQSIMSVGSNSNVKIASFNKESPGIINLVRGEIRSQVTKDYMEMEDKTKSKLFIRTKTAAMGIRGTDFQVSFTDKNEQTTLVTFEGKVAMNKLDASTRNQDLNQRDLDKILERKDRVFVTRGEMSNINRDTRKIGPPQKLDPKVMDTMMKSDFPKGRGGEQRSNTPQNDKNRPGENQGPNQGPNQGSNQQGPGNGPGVNQGPGQGNGPGGNQNPNQGPGNGPRNQGPGQQGPGQGNGPGGNQQGPGPGQGPMNNGSDRRNPSPPK